eukprot:766294-Hanusia_phi.AAC.2
MAGMLQAPSHSENTLKLKMSRKRKFSHNYQRSSEFDYMNIVDTKKNRLTDPKDVEIPWDTVEELRSSGKLRPSSGFLLEKIRFTSLQQDQVLDVPPSSLEASLIDGFVVRREVPDISVADRCNEAERSDVFGDISSTCSDQRSSEKMQMQVKHISALDLTVTVEISAVLHPWSLSEQEADREMM